MKFPPQEGGKTPWCCKGGKVAVFNGVLKMKTAAIFVASWIGVTTFLVLANSRFDAELAWYRACEGFGIFLSLFN